MTHPAEPTQKITLPEHGGKRDTRRRLTLSFQCGITMVACSAGYGGYVAWTSPNRTNSSLAILLGIPAIAGFLFMISAEIFPDLLAPRRLVYPLTWTLPLVFNALVFLSAALLTSTGNSLIAPYEQMRVARLWESPEVLCLVALSQIVCLSAMAALKTGPVE